MIKVLIVYWSGTGNTEKMSELIEQGAAGKGAFVTRKNVSDAKTAEIADYDIVVFGSPSMGDEVIEESEMEPFFSEALPLIKSKKTALFGSYGWGDGEWLRAWEQRAREAGAALIGEGLAVHETPAEASSAACTAYGEKIAAA